MTSIRNFCGNGPIDNAKKKGTPKVEANSSLVWLGPAPPRVEPSCWPTVSGKVSSADNLRRRRLVSKAISDMCLMCKQGKSVDHLFLHCELSNSLWCRLLVQ